MIFEKSTWKEIVFSFFLKNKLHLILFHIPEFLKIPTSLFFKPIWFFSCSVKDKSFLIYDRKILDSARGGEKGARQVHGAVPNSKLIQACGRRKGLWRQKWEIADDMNSLSVVKREKIALELGSLQTQKQAELVKPKYYMLVIY